MIQEAERIDFCSIIHTKKVRFRYFGRMHSKTNIFFLWFLMWKEIWYSIDSVLWNVVHA